MHVRPPAGFQKVLEQIVEAQLPKVRPGGKPLQRLSENRCAPRGRFDQSDPFPVDPCGRQARSDVREKNRFFAGLQRIGPRGVDEIDVALGRPAALPGRIDGDHNVSFFQEQILQNVFPEQNVAEREDHFAFEKVERLGQREQFALN